MKLKCLCLLGVLFARVTYGQYSDSLSEAQVARLQGEYSKCTIQTQVGGVEASSKVEFVLRQDQTMAFRSMYYSGNSECLGEGQVLEHVKGFEVKSVSFSPELQLVDLNHLETGDSYSLIFKGGNVSATILSQAGDIGLVSKLVKQQSSPRTITEVLGVCLEEFESARADTVDGPVICSASVDESLNTESWGAELQIPIGAKVDDMNASSFQSMLQAYRSNYTTERGMQMVEGIMQDGSPFIFVRSGIALDSKGQLQVSLNTFSSDGVGELTRISTSERTLQVFRALVEKIVNENLN